MANLCMTRTAWLIFQAALPAPSGKCSGKWVIVSKCTKCETRELGYVYGDKLEGLSLPGCGDDLVPQWERITSVTDAGEQLVAMIEAGDHNYFAGGEIGQYLSTHNMIQAK